MSEKNVSKPTSGMAIAGLVLGILAAVSSWIPIINNLSFIIGLIGFVLAIVGVVGTMRGKKAGKGLAIAALVINIVALVVVFASQSAMSQAIDDATSGSSVVDTSTTDTTQQDDAAEEDTSDVDSSQQASSTDLAVGTTIDLEDGLSVTVDSVETGLVNIDGSTVVGVHVTYVNNGDEGATYNLYDWKGEDESGAQEYPTYYSDATDDLGSGTLAAGGTKSGSIYFEEGTVKALYFSSMLNNTPTASWVIE